MAVLQLAALCTFLLPDGGVLTVGQRTRRAITQAGDVKLVATETLSFRPGGVGKTHTHTHTFSNGSSWLSLTSSYFLAQA